jgi:hypothetical protein
VTEDEWRKLYENYETAWLLNAIDHIDNLRGHLGDGEHFQPPEIRTDFLKLHGLAMDVVNNGREGRLREMAELAEDLDIQLSDMMEEMEALHRILSNLIQLLPASAYNEEE